jgi:acyl carrier protein
MTIEQKIRAFIVENFFFGESDDNLKDDDSLLENGIIDSTGVLEIVAFLEETYGIELNDEEIIPENLDSITSMSKFIANKQGTVN